MLTSVNAQSAQDNGFFTLGSVTDQIQLLGVDGLEPVKAGVASSPYGFMAGESLVASLGKRNIIFKFGFNPDWIPGSGTVEDLRMLLYRYFLPTYAVTLEFFSTHLPDVLIEGIVEDVAPDIFSKNPQVNVSVLCGQPDFVAVDPLTATGIVAHPTGVGTALLTAIEDSLSDIDYQGTAKTGALVKVEKTATLATYSGNVKLRFVNGTDEYKVAGKLFEIAASGTIDAATHLEVNSVPGNKYLRNVDNTDDILFTDRLNYLLTADWVTLEPGSNRFGVNADTAGQQWTLIYYPRYSGL